MTLTARSELRKSLIKIAFPYIAESLVATLMFYVDSIMLGHIADPHKRAEAIASLGVAGPISYTIAAVLGGIGAATIATVSRAFGESDMEKLRSNAGASIKTAAILGFLGSVIGAFLLPMLAMQYRVPDNPHAVELGAAYTRITAAGIMFYMLEISCAAIMRACGNTITPLLIGIAANLLNILGNYILIYGKFGFPELGVVGAAYSTLAAQVVYGISAFTILMIGVKGIKIPFDRVLRPGKEAIERLTKIATPATIEPAIMQAGFLIYSYIIALMGQSQLAAHRVGIAIESLTFMPGNAIAVACSALVGQSIGMKNAERARLSFHESGRFAMYFMTTVGVIFLVVPQIFVSLFFRRDGGSVNASDDLIFNTSCLLIAVSAFEQPFFSLAMVYCGGLRGAGDTKSPVLIGFVGVWLVRIPCTYILGHVVGLGVLGAWLTMTIDWFVRLSLAYIIFRRGKWADVRL